MSLGTNLQSNPYGIYSNDGTASDFSLNGTVTAVPEPSTYAVLAGFATLGLVLARRRRVRG